MTLYLIRGLPGSGKSTLARRLTPHAYEADAFFVRDGVYTFNPDQIGEAHAQCQAHVRAAMRLGATPIAVSNTFTQQWELDTYRALAQEYGYTVVELTMGGRFPSVHGVPSDVIQRMADRWEA